MARASLECLAEPAFRVSQPASDDAALALAAAMIQGATWRTDRLAQAAADPLIAATDLADHLTQRGLPFRQAHEIVGRIVRAAEAGQRRLDRGQPGQAAGR